MTQPTREELLAENAKLRAAIVEWHIANNARELSEANCKLRAIARSVLAERAEGKGHAGA